MIPRRNLTIEGLHESKTSVPISCMVVFGTKGQNNEPGMASTKGPRNVRGTGPVNLIWSNCHHELGVWTYS